MLKIRILFFVSCFLSAGMLAQNKIVVEGISPDLHLLHKVEPKETWYSLGRLYNIGPNELVSYNHTRMDKPLYIGQMVKVPLVDENFTQTGQKAGDEVLVPLYHYVQEKEWMYRISVNHNKVPIEALEKWNAVTNEQLRAGMPLVVGFLKVKPSLSALAKYKTRNTISVPAAPPASRPAEQGDAATGIAQADKKAEVREVPAKVEKEEPAKAEPEKQETVQTITTVSNNETPDINFRGGSFRKQYRDGGNNASGNAGIFRSTSGWSDGKYYALMNDVPVGTIIKVNFSSTNKSIYAKVLGPLPEMKESVGLVLRLSDAAASELGVSLNKFYVEVKY